MWRTSLLTLDQVAVFGKLSGDWWRVVTATFTYNNTGYAFATLFTIALYGWLMERRHGPATVLVLFAIGGIGGIAVSAVVYDFPFVLGANGAALALLIAWAIPDLLALRAGEEIDGDMLGTVALALAVGLMPLVVKEASWVADGVGVLTGLLLGIPLGADAGALRRLRPVPAHGTDADRAGRAVDQAPHDRAGDRLRAGRARSVAASRPPDVIASHTSHRRASGTSSANVENSSAWARLRRVPPATALERVGQQLETPAMAGTDSACTSAATPLASASSCRWPSSPKPVTSVIPRTPAARAATDASRLSVVITSTAAASGGSSTPRLTRGRDRARAERLGQHERVAGPAAGVGQHLVGSDDPGHGEAVLGLGVVDRMAADNRHPGLGCDAAPPRRISTSSSPPSSSSENATRFSALIGVPPIA